MKNKGQLWIGIGMSLCLLMIILDTKTALIGASEGIELSIRVVIPSLFPFLVLSNLIYRSFSGIHIPFLKPINRLCGIPNGAESIYLLGFVGGYPVGARSIAQAYKDGGLQIADARRMLGFCSNAGPAFIFGMASTLFSTKAPLWALWCIHIVSSLLVAIILPKHNTGRCNTSNKPDISLPDAVSNGVKTMGLICGWVTVFRILIAFLRHWLLWLLPPGAQATLIGILELSNGCICLNNLTSPGARFVLCAAFLGFGGLCVAMQTVSVTKNLGTGMYFPGKILQCIFSILLSLIIQHLLFNDGDIYTVQMPYLFALLALLFIGIALLYRSKKVVAIPV